MTEDFLRPSAGSIEVLNMMRWSGDPRFGAFAVVIDGALVGEAPAFECGFFPTKTGRHSVQVKLRQFSSSVVTVDVALGQVRRLIAQRKGENPYTRLFYVLFARRSALSLRLLTPGRDDDVQLPERDVGAPARLKSRTKRIKPLMQCGLALIIVGFIDGLFGRGPVLLIWLPPVLGICLIVGCVEWIRRKPRNSE
jgi:hypothetical protein